MMTWRFLVWFIFLILSIISAHFKLRVFPHLIILFLLSLPILSILFMLLGKRKLKIELEPQTQFVYRHDSAKWKLTIFNTSKLSPLRVKLKTADKVSFDIRLNPQQVYQTQLNATAHHTGLVKVPQFDLWLYDAFSFFRHGLYLTHIESVFALPLLNENNQIDEITAHLADDIKQALILNQNQEDELLAIRQMNIGDSMKRVHWKVSARVNEWMVRHDEMGPQPILEILVFPDSIDPNNEIERTQRDVFLDIVASQLETLLTQRYKLNVNHLHLDSVGSLPQGLMTLAQLEISHPLKFDDLIPQVVPSLYIVFVQSLNLEMMETLGFLSRNSLSVLLYVDQVEVEQTYLDLAMHSQITLVRRKDDENQ